MKKIILTLVLASLTSFAQASTEAEDKLQVLKIMQQYTPLVSCESSFEQAPKEQGIKALKNIHTVEKNKDTAVYYVLWSADMGCGGGSGSMSNFVSEVAKYGSWKQLNVQDNYAFGQNVGLNYGFIESIQKINSLKFEVIAWDYADEKYGGKDGGMNFPANKFKYTLEREQFEAWQITHQVLLEQNK